MAFSSEIHAASATPHTKMLQLVLAVSGALTLTARSDHVLLGGTFRLQPTEAHQTAQLLMVELLMGLALRAKAARTRSALANGLNVQRVDSYPVRPNDRHPLLAAPL